MVKAPRLYIRDSGLVHELLGIGSAEALAGHPVVGASWEGFALEQVLAKLPKTDAWFWGTQGGAELDLFIQAGGRRIGFEFKVSDAPKMTKSLSIVYKDLALDELLVVKPLGRGYPLEKRIRVLSVEEALVCCNEIAKG
jgi:predicted AAA+ superfamily ATPase